jgi:sialate O-acetylesterase
MKKIIILFLLLIAFFKDFAAVKPNSLFSTNGVLQQGVIVPVWGTANANEKVTIEFVGQSITVTANEKGKWLIKLQPLKAGGPFTMIMKGESNTITLNNILVGEVWLCSGQSNMGFPVRSIRPVGNYPKAEDVLKDAQNYPLIRQYSIPLKKSTSIPDKIEDAGGKWLVCDSITAKNFTAVGYIFGRELFKKLNVPIGIINSSYGGTAIENWISKDVLESFPELNSIFTNYEKAFNEFPQKAEEFIKNEQQLLEKYRTDSASAVAQKKELPRKPTTPMHPAERGGPTGLYNTMIYPLEPFAFKGIVWYQGEANGGRGLQYRTLLPALINSWRKDWNMGNFPFIIIQIPGWKGHTPELREAQLLTRQNIQNTAMTVITDCDDTLDVHPGNKQPVGERAALAARVLAYNDKLEFEGPTYQSMKIEKDKIILTFTHAEGLYAKEGDLKDFTIASDDKIFVSAKAEIKNNKVIVYSDAIKKPTAVRLGWRLCPQVNLYNKAGLVATAFRTDVQ